MSFILLGILNSQVEAAGGGAYELIESNILTSTTAEITFTSIPQDYKHLQIRTTHRRDAFGFVGANLYMRFNSDSGNNYARHDLRGDGTTVYSSAQASTTVCGYIWGPANQPSANTFGASVIDILDYSSTNKYTTAKIISGSDDDASSNPVISTSSGLWMNTNAVTSITLGAGTGNVAGSRFSLYGVRG